MNFRQKAVGMQWAHGAIIIRAAEKSRGFALAAGKSSERIQSDFFGKRKRAVHENQSVLRCRIALAMVDLRRIVVSRIAGEILRPRVGPRTVGGPAVAILAAEMQKTAFTQPEAIVAFGLNDFTIA